jgi:predicted Zn-dependent peptidase
VSESYDSGVLGLRSCFGGASVANFQTTARGRYFVHSLSTTQFKTRHIVVKLSRPLSRESVTATAVLPYLWMEGTATLPSARHIMQYADELYGTVVRTGIGKRADRHVVEVSLSVPEETALTGADGLFEKALHLALDIISDPKLDGGEFPKAHVDRERTLHQKRIQSIYDDKIAYAMERCIEEMCKGSPVGLSRFGYIEDLEALSGQSLWATHQDLLKQAEIHVYVIGQTGDGKGVANEILDTLEQRLGLATRSDAALGVVEPLPYVRNEPQYVVDRQPVQQGKLNLGFRTNTAYRSDDFLALMLCNGVLGAFPHSKLFTNVREKANLAYYASSRLDSLTGILSIQTGIEVANYEQALDIILRQVEEIQKGAVSDKELNFTKRGFRNQYLQLADQPGAMTDVHFHGVLGGIHREIPDILEKIDAVTVDDVVRVASTLKLDTVYFLSNEEVKRHG